MEGNAAAVVTAVIAGVLAIGQGLSTWLIQRSISKRDKVREQKAEDARKERKEQDAAREKNEVLLMELVTGALALCEALALAMKRGHTNGEVEAALKYAKEVKHKHKDFLREQAVKKMNNK